MEGELQIKSSLMAPSKKDMMSLANAQLGFMNMFAIPLFQGVADILPGMQYTVDELDTNKGLFEAKVEEEKAKEPRDARSRLRRERTCSPRTRSVAANEAKDEGAGRAPDKPSPAPGGGSGGRGETRRVASDVEGRVGPGQSSGPERPSRAPWTGDDGVNGRASPSEAAAETADGDAPESQGRVGSTADSKTSTPAGGHGRSETTEGSASGACGGDWQSQATSGLTGKPALSPSTQGTSIVSNESLDRTLSASGPNSSPPSTSNHGSPTTAFGSRDEHGEELSRSSSMVQSEGKTVKKRPSRFRMKDFPFFRRNKGSSPPLPAADTTK